MQFRVARPLLESSYAFQVQCLGEAHPTSAHTLSLVSVCQSLHSGSSGLQAQPSSRRSGSSSLDDSPLLSPAASHPSIAATWQLSDSEVAYWMLQQQARDELSADPQRAPAPPPDVTRTAEGFSILQPVEGLQASGASGSEASGDDGNDEI